MNVCKELEYSLAIEREQKRWSISRMIFSLLRHLNYHLQKYYASYQFWNKVAKKFYKEKRSRIGSRYEHSAYLGTVMKQLISCGMPVNQAWKWIHDIRGLYYFIKDFPQYQSIDISYYENNEKLLSDDKGIIAKIRNSMPICIFDRKFFFFSDETVEYHKLYGGWIGGYSYCIPWIVCDA